MTTPWTTLTRGDRDFDTDLNERSVVGMRKHLAGPKTLFNKLGVTVSTTRPYYTQRIDGIIGTPEEIAEGTQEAPPMTPINVADIRIRPRLYASALVLSQERVDDDGLGLVQKLAPKVLERMLERIEIDFQNMILGSPTVYNADRDQRDGVALASASHPVGPYGILSGNVAGTPSALTESSLATAVTSFMSQYDDNGDVAPLMPQKFILTVHPSKLLYAQQLTKSLSSTADYKNSGVINPVSGANGLTFEVFPALYQTSTTAWSLTAVDEGESGMVVVMRKMPNAPEKLIKKNPDQVQYVSKMRYSMAITDWRRFYYNAGA